MTLEYKITLERGGVTVTLHVGSAAPVKEQLESDVKPVKTEGASLGTTFESGPLIEKTKAGGSPGGPKPGGGGEDPAGPGGGGRGPGPVVILGPIVVCGGEDPADPGGGSDDDAHPGAGKSARR